MFESATRHEANKLAQDMWGRDSLSGSERNRLFLNLKGQKFQDVSLLSGADHKADGRSVVLLDYNQDGLQDLAVINCNSPKLLLFKNQCVEPGNRWIKLRLQGGNERAIPAPGLSNRDGYGAIISIQDLKKPLILEHRCGEGYSAQSSRTLHVGLGNHSEPIRLKVAWPSGKITFHSGLTLNQTHTLTEQSAP